MSRLCFVAARGWGWQRGWVALKRPFISALGGSSGKPRLVSRSSCSTGSTHPHLDGFATAKVVDAHFHPPRAPFVSFGPPWRCAECCMRAAMDPTLAPTQCRRSTLHSPTHARTHAPSRLEPAEKSLFSTSTLIRPNPPSLSLLYALNLARATLECPRMSRIQLQNLWRREKC